MGTLEFPLFLRANWQLMPTLPGLECIQLLQRLWDVASSCTLFSLGNTCDPKQFAPHSRVTHFSMVDIRDQHHRPSPSLLHILGGLPIRKAALPLFLDDGLSSSLQSPTVDRLPVSMPNGCTEQP